MSPGKSPKLRGVKLPEILSNNVNFELPEEVYAGVKI